MCSKRGLADVAVSMAWSQRGCQNYQATSGQAIHMTTGRLRQTQIDKDTGNYSSVD